MDLVTIVLVPFVASLVGLVVTSRGARRAVLAVAALLHLALVLRLFTVPAPAPILAGMFALDPLGHLVLTLVSVVFAATSIYLVQYRHLMTPSTPRTFLVPLLLAGLTAMSVMAMARHLAVLWVASGGLTLSAAPLVYLNRGPRSLEAAWKYLMLSSLGIAIALLGLFFVAIAATDPGGRSSGLGLDDLLARAREGRIVVPWLKAGFILMLVGFGTKVGLAPMHTWKPDTYAEAPTPVAALMASALTNCAFLGVLRGHQICVAAGLGDFAGRLLVVLGLVSIGTAAAFAVAQGDAKRLLAYSGIEHMGVIALGVGIGGRAIWGGLLHMVGHSLAKGLLFFAVGNVVYAYETKSIPEITGVLRRLPFSGVLLLAGFFTTVGFPPFSIFLSELTIAQAAFAGQQNVTGALMLGFLAILFVAVISLALGMAQGPDPRGEGAPREREPFLLVLPGFVLLGLVLAVGVHVPEPLDRALVRAAALLGG